MNIWLILISILPPLAGRWESACVSYVHSLPLRPAHSMMCFVAFPVLWIQLIIERSHTQTPTSCYLVHVKSMHPSLDSVSHDVARNSKPASIREQIPAGMEPVKILCDTSRRTSSVSCPISLGIVPRRMLSLISRVSSAVHFPIWLVTVPTNSLRSSVSNVSRVIRPISLGMVPLSSFNCKFRLSSWSIAPNSVGSVPVSSNPSRVR
mmetsp:Transcript_21394/g.49371  ORF Transcript_21394/g.49371 Transcript_21394/m.49371 type:complete len:207 (-) Transcript_21394:384-1004(-)